MIIRSERMTVSDIISRFIGTVYNLVIVIGYSCIIAMSYNIVTPESMFVLWFCVARLIFANAYYTFITKEELQEYEDSPFTAVLVKHPFLGWPNHITSVWMLWLFLKGTLISVAEVDLMWYPIMVFCVFMTSHFHKTQKGIKLITKLRIQFTQ